MELTTNRLQIRRVKPEDNQSIYKYRSDPEINRYLTSIPESVEDISDLITRSSGEINVPGTWFQFVVVERHSGVLTGDVGIHFLKTDPENRQVEIGYTLDKKYQGKGYATEALTEVINYLVNDLDKHRVIASIDPTNRDSIRLIERLGFRKEAHFKKGLFFRGEWVDDAIYAILGSEWKEKIKPNGKY